MRLLFRDVPADEIAAAFRAAGASLITVSAERAGPAESQDADVERTGRPPRQKRRKSRSAATPALGALSMRYFYALGETVYTVTISAPSEVVPSVAPIFPVAALSERELHTRMSVVFHRPGIDLND